MDQGGIFFPLPILFFPRRKLKQKGIYNPGNNVNGCIAQHSAMKKMTLAIYLESTLVNLCRKEFILAYQMARRIIGLDEATNSMLCFQE